MRLCVDEEGLEGESPRDLVGLSKESVSWGMRARIILESVRRGVGRICCAMGYKVEGVGRGFAARSRSVSAIVGINK